jgi:putative ABC transport system permease protein
MRELLRRAWHAIRQRHVDADLAEEMEFHRVMTERDLRARGIDATEASFEARRTFGSSALAQDQARDVWVPRALQGLAQDVRLAVRTLWASRLVSAVAILSLALGIGANTAIFSLLNSILLRPLPVHDPSHLAVLTIDNGPQRPWGYPVWDEIRQRPQLFAHAAAWTTGRGNLAVTGEASFATTIWASGSFFDTLGVSAILGRTFSYDAEDRRGASERSGVAVISYDFWQRRFGGAADAIGRPLSIDDIPFTIVGVMPPAFFGPEVGRDFDVIVPLGDHPGVRAGNGNPGGSLAVNVAIMVRLKPGQTIGQATSAARGVQPQIRDATLPSGWPKQFLSQYMREAFVMIPAGRGNTSLERRYARPLLIIMAVVALVLLIACANIANLLLARATARRHELCVRRALGASRWRLVRQLLTESAILAGAGAALGMLFASWSSRFLVAQLSTDANPLSLDLSLDSHVAAFTIIVAAMTTLMFGVAPAARASGVVPMSALKQDARTTAEGARTGFSGGLVVAQLGLSLVLVVVAGLFVQTFMSLESRPLGFDPNRILVVGIDAQRSRINPRDRVAMYEDARDAVSRLPGVAAAALCGLTPIVGADRPMLGQPIESVSGGAELPPRGAMSALNLVSPGWLSTLNVPLLGGRDLSDDDRRDTLPVAVVNEAFARKFLNGASPVGHSITLFLPGRPTPPVEIVGVAADTVYNASLRASEPAAMYLPMSQLGGIWLPFLASANLIVRADRLPPASLIKSVAAAIGTERPELALTFHTLDDQIDASLVQERVLAMVAGAFGVVALLLAGLGLYGVTAYAVSRRRMEIGIRMALGAAPGNVVRLVISRIVLLVAAGVLVGAVLSWWASRFVATLLYGLQPHDPTTLVGAALVLGAVALIAGWLPARRAARIDPAVALRYE